MFAKCVLKFDNVCIDRFYTENAGHCTMLLFVIAYWINNNYITIYGSCAGEGNKDLHKHQALKTLPCQAFLHSVSNICLQSFVTAFHVKDKYTKSIDVLLSICKIRKMFPQKHVRVRKKSALNICNFHFIFQVKSVTGNIAIHPVTYFGRYDTQTLKLVRGITVLQTPKPIGCDYAPMPWVLMVVKLDPCWS